jgi:hypothetical protein
MRNEIQSGRAPVEEGKVRDRRAPGNDDDFDARRVMRPTARGELSYPANYLVPEIHCYSVQKKHMGAKK